MTFTRLERLGERNAEIRGIQLNWVGTYRHAAETWLDYMEWLVKRGEVAWQANETPSM